MAKFPKKRSHRTAAPALSAREVRFCRHWVETGNATQSYASSGLPHATLAVASVLAFRLLRKVKIREYIRDLQDAAAEAARVGIEELARGFKRATDVDLTQLLGPDGEVLPPDKWPESIRLSVIRIEVEELTEMQADPANPRRKRKVAIGTKWKVWVENKTECRKVLAQWKRMIGHDADGSAVKDHAPLVIEHGPETVDPPTHEPEALPDAPS